MTHGREVIAGARSNVSDRAPRFGFAAWAPTVVLFLLVYVISYIDRQILSLVVGPVKASLHLGDFQVGLLQGFAFSLVLSTGSVLTGPIVDRGNRVKVIGVCMIVWCAMTVLCGFASTFTMLLIARTGVALAEGIVPMAVLSIICDVAPRASVPRASALFNVATYLGSGAALLLGGPALAVLGKYAGQPLPVVGPFEPWRGLFWLLGGPGLVFGASVLLGAREPTRASAATDKTAAKTVVPFLRANWPFLTTFVAVTVSFTAIGYTTYAWMPTYMIRLHHLSPARAGLAVGAVFVTSGIGGSVFGSWIMSRAGVECAMSHVVRTIVRLAFCLAPLVVLMPFSPAPAIALAALAVVFFVMAAGLSSVMTPIVLFAPAHLRGQVLSLVGLINATAGGLGPMCVGALNDFVLGTTARMDIALAITFGGASLLALIAGPAAARIATAIDARSRGSDATAICPVETFS